MSSTSFTGTAITAGAILDLDQNDPASSNTRRRHPHDRCSRPPDDIRSLELAITTAFDADVAAMYGGVFSGLTISASSIPLSSHNDWPIRGRN